ncbi:L-threonylcarbamoyladenylate synthase [Marinobacter daepoensis]|uniref:L-threonylcarbamoyladenylate synthase n=1 Tax=Marinobacter daepoensis TaxID=262077 RepID=A0ABS3BIT2_9GAMM|nr:L-threonylcarbamoyladenylate synthase [Marinobacter daepoensis]MBN7770135.1 L-threonylcarbamoyladenylate synthase [Marinobacter daepoensis]MBY6079581.1 L-threonylcarbamoyladenylate synthase [Marinobacter daepoensis]
MTKTANVKTASKDVYTEAARQLLQGGLVVVQTRTNYNLICDPRNAAAIERVFQIKKRTKFGPLLILIDAVEDALQFGALPFGYSVNDLHRIWPSELTIIMNKKYPFPSALTLGLDTLGISCQGDSDVREVIRQFGFPVAATSANLSGQGDIFVDLDKAVEDLGDDVDLIIDGGQESAAARSSSPDKSNSIIDITFERPYLVRKGLVSVERISHCFTDLEIDTACYQAKLKQRVSKLHAEAESLSS